MTAPVPVPRITPQRRAVTGHYAGPVSRTLAIGIDAAIATGVYTLSYAGLQLLLEAFFGSGFDHTGGDLSGVVAATTFSLWGFLYFFVSLAVAGRTIGMSLVGVRVLRTAGSAVTVGGAFVRTLVFPLSLLFFGLGLVPIVLGARHRAMHDAIAGTVVVYDWGSRTAQLPGPLSEFLARR